MRKSFYILCLSILLFTSCSNKNILQGQRLNNIEIKKINTSIFEFSTNIAKDKYVDSSDTNDEIIHFINTVYLFDEIANYGIYLGYKYFVVLEPYKTNNILGSPINTMDKFLDYCFGGSVITDVVLKGDCNDLKSYNYKSEIKVLYLNEKNKNFVVYDTKDVVSENIKSEYIYSDIIGQKLKSLEINHF